MRTADERVKRYIRAEREANGWSQTELARQAGVSRNTVAALERGGVLREGKEAAIERALGWKLGSIDEVRMGGEPSRIDPVSQDIQRVREATTLPTELREHLEYLLRQEGEGRDQSDTQGDTDSRVERRYG